VIEWLYRKIFIAIIPDGESCDVRVVVLKKKKIISKAAERFEGVNLNDSILSYIRKYTDESPFHYIALLNPDPTQGALNGCSLHNIEEGLTGSKTLCRNKKWLLYASLKELDAQKKRYAGIGLDFIFSPFSVIEQFFADKIGTGFALYALAQKESFTLAFFDDGKLEYAHNFPMHRYQSGSGTEDNDIGFSIGVEDHDEDDLGQGINLDDIESLDDLDIIDELDSLSDIEDLDSLDDIVEFSEDDLTLEEKRSAVPHNDEVKHEMERFNDDYIRFEFIQKMLERFYAGEECRNRFVETVYIADGCGSGSELKRYLEEELFLNVLIRRIDIGDEVISLAISEEEG
jgi:hypothetical protein